MAPQSISMTTLRQHALSLKKLREKAKNLRAPSIRSGDVEIEEEERWSCQSFGADNRRVGWPQPTRFPTERERRRLAIGTDALVDEHVPDLNGRKSCSWGESDSECEFSESSNYDDWNAADCNAPGFKTPRPRSWRACVLLASKSQETAEAPGVVPLVSEESEHSPTEGSLLHTEPSRPLVDSVHSWPLANSARGEARAQSRVAKLKKMSRVLANMRRKSTMVSRLGNNYEDCQQDLTSMARILIRE
eukprot:TRINITY_DN14490_c0_g2_i2.p1 TRINITY_DN14490_c0_g2~~TRINITY_DN14490_c0_g2_i2.p1  ORF type:complete len:270 (+),score=23.03 TRINITY_DN14490_c0_g2_i2:71-811(+)